MDKVDRSKETGEETIETISAAASEQQQVNVQIDDGQAPVTYATIVRVSGSAEEFTLDFSGPLRPTGPKSARLKVDQRIVMNPWAAKRLCIALTQAVTRYEKGYGQLEIDPRKRLIKQPVAATPPPPQGKLS